MIHECVCPPDWIDPSCPHCNWGVARCLEAFRVSGMGVGPAGEFPKIEEIKAWFEERGFTLLTAFYDREVQEFVHRNGVHVVPGPYRVKAKIRATTRAAVARTHIPEWRTA